MLTMAPQSRRWATYRWVLAPDARSPSFTCLGHETAESMLQGREHALSVRPGHWHAVSVRPEHNSPLRRAIPCLVSVPRGTRTRGSGHQGHGRPPAAPGCHFWLWYRDGGRFSIARVKSAILTKNSVLMDRLWTTILCRNSLCLVFSTFH